MFWLNDAIDRLFGWTIPRDVKEAGAAAIAEAERLWASDIYDPSKSDHSIRALASKKAIDRMLQACGWTWEVPYLGDGQMKWCLIFAGACWVRAGLKPDIAKTWIPSTYRIDAYARYKPFDNHKNPRPASGPYRLIAELDEHSTSLPFEPRPGDFMTIGPPGSGPGLHGVLVKSFDGRWFDTIEGNANGTGPDGKPRQGVIKNRRRLGGNGWHARRIIRPAPADLL